MSVSSQTAAPPGDVHDSTRGFSWRRQVCRVQCLALSIAAALLCAGPASARPVDTQSAHVALTANRQFLRSLVNAVPAQRAAAGSYVASIAQTCPGILSGLGPITLAAEKPGVRDVIAEGLGDLEVAVIAQGRGALATFARRATSLSWSRPKTSSDVRHYFAAENALYNAPPSDLCADAGALVADGGQTEPPQTSQWLGTFKSLTRDANATGRVLGRDLNRLSGPEDLAVIATTTCSRRGCKPANRRCCRPTSTSCWPHSDSPRRSECNSPTWPAGLTRERRRGPCGAPIHD
jgi:hypothetical protein